jgi:hypothetical protein
MIFLWTINRFKGSKGNVLAVSEIQTPQKAHLENRGFNGEFMGKYRYLTFGDKIEKFFNNKDQVE